MRLDKKLKKKFQKGNDGTNKTQNYEGKRFQNRDGGKKFGDKAQKFNKPKKVFGGKVNKSGKSKSRMSKGKGKGKAR